MKNTELFIPTWPNKAATLDQLGDARYASFDNECDSMWVSLRARPKGEGYEYADEYRVWSYIGLYVWMSADYGIDISVKAHSIHSGDAHFIELLLKRLKWADARLKGMGKFTLENLPLELIDLCKRLGIKQTVEYRGFGIPDTYAPVTSALQLTAREISARVSQLKPRAA